MKRYVSLYFTYLQRAIKSRLEYKKDAVVGIFSFLITNAMQFFALMFIVKSIPSLNGWGMYELGFLYGFSLMPKALDHLFTDSLWYVGYWYVRTGIIDRFLIRPVNSLFQVVAETFQPEAVGEVFMGLALLIVCGTKIDMCWSVGNVTVMIVATLFGALVFTGLKLITCSIAFWTKRSGQLMSMVYNVSDFAKYPIKIYHPIIRFVMTFILPFGLVISMPVGAFLRNMYNPWLVSGGIILAAAVIFGIGCLVWNQGIKNYESSGS